MPRSDDDAVPPLAVSTPSDQASVEPTERASGERAVRRDPLPAEWRIGTADRGAKHHATTGLDARERSEDHASAPFATRRLLSDEQVISIADVIRDETGTSHEDDPRVRAYFLGITAVPGFPEAGERPTAEHAVFQWDRDPRECKLRVTCAMVHSLFLARGIQGSYADLWAVVIELLLPQSARWMGRRALCFFQRHCPESVICAYVLGA